MRATLDACLLAFSLLSCSGALGWSVSGHQTVGAIADELIAGAPTAEKVRAILGTTLRTASIWADCAKNIKRENDGSLVYKVDPEAAQCRPYENAASEKVMIDFVSRNWDNCRPAPGSEACHRQYHYTDIAVQRDAYASRLVGASQHDVVAAMVAAIAVLQDQPAPEPFRIANKKEALRLLAHYVGDMHQPLHVGGVYLSAEGALVDPDAGTFDPASDTIGGNRLLDQGRKLHTDWDEISGDLTADRLSAATLQEARDLAPTAGAIASWPTTWATDSLGVSKKAFADLAYSKVDGTHRWQVSLPPDYSETRRELQRRQLVKAGARLAQLLQTLFP